MKTTGGKGFTLLELLIVVIVVGILAGFALPQFSRITTRARQAEARNMLGAIATAELIYYQEQRSFTNSMTDLILDLPADANSNWDYTASGANATGVLLTATGDAGPVSGTVITMTVRDDGSRS